MSNARVHMALAVCLASSALAGCGDDESTCPVAEVPARVPSGLSIDGP